MKFHNKTAHSTSCKCVRVNRQAFHFGAYDNTGVLSLDTFHSEEIAAQRFMEGTYRKTLTLARLYSSQWDWKGEASVCSTKPLNSMYLTWNPVHFAYRIHLERGFKAFYGIHVQVGVTCSEVRANRFEYIYYFINLLFYEFIILLAQRIQNVQNVVLFAMSMDFTVYTKPEQCYMLHDETSFFLAFSIPNTWFPRFNYFFYHLIWTVLTPTVLYKWNTKLTIQHLRDSQINIIAILVD